MVYELHVGSFTRAGTCEAVVEQLDHLVEPGVTHVELMPLQEFSGVHGWGYDRVDLYAPHQAYGDPEGSNVWLMRTIATQTSAGC
jgi:maltooligosyltrehalose trehalohydrolase